VANILGNAWWHGAHSTISGVGIVVLAFVCHCGARTAAEDGEREPSSKDNGGSVASDGSNGSDSRSIADASTPDTPVSAKCAPTDATSPPNGGFGTGCRIVFGWGWDGSKCYPIVGCVCAGRDCNRLIPDRNTCQALCGN
jgi:hypothetical protein